MEDLKLKNNYNFCLFKHKTNEVILFDQSEVTGDCITDSFIHDVTVEIDDKGILHLSGLEDEFHFARYEEDIKDLVSRPRDKDIRKFTGLKLFGHYIIKPYEYVRGWFAYPMKNHVNYIINHYKIKLLK